METVTVSEFIEKNKLSADIQQIKERPDGGPDGFMDDMAWRKGATHWKVKINRQGGRVMTVYYSMGPAHTEPPKIKHVLNSLRFDASCGDVFEAFCSEFGYDTDSRKAERVFKACHHIYRRLVKFLGPELFEELLATEPL